MASDPPAPGWLVEALGDAETAEAAWGAVLEHGTLEERPEPTDWQAFAADYIADRDEGVMHRTRARLAELEAHSMGVRVLVIDVTDRLGA